MGTPLLELKDVSKVFSKGLVKKEQLIALDHFSFTIPQETAMITAVAGESGSGKTTLSLIALGLVAPSSGQILFDGEDIWQMSAERRRIFRREVQAVFQDPYGVYNPFYPVDHVLQMVVEKFRLADDHHRAQRMVGEALEVVGLKPDDVLGKYPHQLSGGQRQRIMIARAFLPKPRLIVADEPVSMVDASLRALILENVLRLKREFKISFIYITHDLSTVYQVSDEIHILYLGGTAECGDIEGVIESPRHPYTQLLISSVPVAEPDPAWKAKVDLPPEDEIRKQTLGGCRFAPRCPHVMERCRQGVPPLYQVESNQYASCFLHADRPIRDGGAAAPEAAPR